jgi:hypothetical protein
MSAEIANKLQDLPEAVVSGLTIFVESAAAIFGPSLKSIVL